MTLNGTLLDSKTNKGIEFGAIQVTDSKGKPIGNNGVNTDENGKYSLKNVKTSDYITTSYVGYAPKTIAANNAVSKGSGIGILNIKIDQTGLTLPQIDIVADKPKTKITTSGSVITDAKTIAKPEEKAKEPMKLWVKIALGVGAVTVLGIIIFLATKENKKGKK